MEKWSLRTEYIQVFFLEKFFMVIDIHGLTWIRLDYSKVNDWRRK